MTSSNTKDKLEPGNSCSPEGNPNATVTNNIQIIQAEASNMISLLKRLEKEEYDIQCQLEVLAREALLCGFQADIHEPPIPKKRTKKIKP